MCVFLLYSIRLNMVEKPFSIYRFSDQNILHFIANRILSHVRICRYRIQYTYMVGYIRKRVDKVGSLYFDVLCTMYTMLHTKTKRHIYTHTFQVWCKQTKPFWLHLMTWKRTDEIRVKHLLELAVKMLMQTFNGTPNIDCIFLLLFMSTSPITNESHYACWTGSRKTNKLILSSLEKSHGSCSHTYSFSHIQKLIAFLWIKIMEWSEIYFIWPYITCTHITHHYLHILK